MDDDFLQPGNLFRLMPPEAQERLVTNMANSLKKVPKFIQERQVAHLYKGDKAYGDGVAKRIGLA